MENLIALFVLTVAFNSGALLLVLTRHYVWAAVLGLIGIALIVMSGPETRMLWQARKGVMGGKKRWVSDPPTA